MNQHRIVLTGASGMLGQAILRQLSTLDDVSAVALYRTAPEAKTSAKVINRIIDYDQDDELRALLHDFRPTVFIHAAATGMQHPLPDEATLRKINIELPVMLAETLSDVAASHFLHVSSGLAYQDQGRPLCETDPLQTSHPYGASKAEAEKRLQTLALARGIPLTIIRPFSFTGEGDFGSRLFPSLLRSAVENQSFALSAGDQIRDHSSVNDIARGILAAAMRDHDEVTSSQIFNLGSEDIRPLRQMVSEVVDELGIAVDLQFGVKSYSANEPMFAVADSSRARTQLKWKPRESLAGAVWQLAHSSFPSLQLNKPLS